MKEAQSAGDKFKIVICLFEKWLVTDRHKIDTRPVWHFSMTAKGLGKFTALKLNADFIRHIKYFNINYLRRFIAFRMPIMRTDKGMTRLWDLKQQEGMRDIDSAISERDFLNLKRFY